MVPQQTGKPHDYHRVFVFYFSLIFFTITLIFFSFYILHQKLNRWLILELKVNQYKKLLHNIKIIQKLNLPIHIIILSQMHLNLIIVVYRQWRQMVYRIIQTQICTRLKMVQRISYQEYRVLQHSQIILPIQDMHR